MEVLNAIGAVSQGIRLVKGLIPKQGSSVNAPQQSFGEVLLQHQDRNGDGALSAQELKVSSALYGRLDRNSDGVLSMDELNAGATLIQKAFNSEERIDQYFESHDANHDTFINLMESGLDSDRFKNVDSNADKQLNRSEISAAYQSRSMDLST